MLEASDIFYIILAFCVLWVTVFFCWFLFQVAMVIKNVNALLHEIKFQFERIDQTLNGIKSKFNEGSDHMGSMVDHLKENFASVCKKCSDKMKKRK